ncbi:redoxin domain-containing protein [Bradyrhizobium sp. AZCC 2230]|uniref:redoxin domain-containing protein n=1 Tax=Bradyrhizobium sp. AZCC 2230 TaxID=3117021 RepID=UPI002FF20DC3
MVTRLIWSNDGSDPPGLPAGRGRSSDNTDTLGRGLRAVRAGKKAPDFRLRDQHGRRVALRELLLRSAVVLRFCRNENTASCVREFNSLSALQGGVERLGAALVVIAVEPFDPRPLGKDAASFPFPILADKKGDVAQSYGLTFQVSAPNGPDIDDTNGNPQEREIGSAPATYVIDQTGLIALAFVDVECRSLMDHGQILMALECLARRKQQPLHVESKPGRS